MKLFYRRGEIRIVVLSRENIHAVSFACLAVLATVLYCGYFYEQQALWYRLWYYTPAAATAGAWCVGRLRERLGSVPICILDLVVLAIAICRPLWGFPPVSGHAVFAVYALMTGRNRVTVALAILLLAITLYAKLFLWHGDPTLWPGLGLGLLLGALRLQSMKNATKNDNP